MSTRNKVSLLIYKVKCTLEKHEILKRQRKMAKTILHYYAQNPTKDTEVQAALNYLQCHPLTVLPGEFTHKYKAGEVAVLLDTENGLHYVMHEGKRLYFRRSSTVEHIRLIYNGLRMEQDVASPHCYQSSEFKVEKGDVLFDVGSAEGIFSLTHIEKLQHCCLFEVDEEWIEALQATFLPWADKVTIVNKYVSDRNDAQNITLDTFADTHALSPSFVKIDVEGAEEAVLAGASGIVAQVAPLKMALCTYHKEGDFEKFTGYFAEKDFQANASHGVMLFLNGWREMRPPYFRKGVLQAFKKAIS